MKRTALRGWNATIEKAFIPGQEEPEWMLVFTETLPPTGDQIVFAMNRDTRDGIVRGLTDGIVLAGGDLPRV